jgi:glycosyltransferase involved in cell wall biosynthesis
VSAPAPRPATVAVVIPALDEEASVGAVVCAIPREMTGAVVTRVVVADNGSADRTADAAAAAGAEVVREPARGYGRACLAGLAAVAARHPPDIVAFLDGDLSDRPEELPEILAPILRGEADLVIGSRVLGARAGRVEKGALLPQARAGNALAGALLRARWGARFTDLGPFRAIRYPALLQLRMSDPTFGWTVEMQAKAARAGLRCAEVPVGYRRRVGRSKITGTLTGSLRAGAKILWTIGRLAVG